MSALEQTAWSAVESVREMLRVGEAAKIELAYLHEMLDGAHIPRYSAPDEDGKAGPFSMAHRLGMLIEREKMRYEEAGSLKKELNRAKGAMDYFDPHDNAPLDQRINGWKTRFRLAAVPAPSAPAAKQDPTEQEEIAHLLDKAGIPDTTPEGRRLAGWERVSAALKRLEEIRVWGVGHLTRANVAEAALRQVKVSCTLPCSGCDAMREELAGPARGPCKRCVALHPGWVAKDGLTRLPMNIVEELREVQGDHDGAPGNVGWYKKRPGVYSLVSMKILTAEEGDPDEFQDALQAEKRLRLTAEDQLRAARRKLFEMQQEVESANFELEEIKKATAP